MPRVAKMNNEKERGVTLSTMKKKKKPTKPVLTTMEQKRAAIRKKQRNAPGIEGVLNRVAMAVRPLYNRAEKFITDRLPKRDSNVAPVGKGASISPWKPTKKRNK